MKNEKLILINDNPSVLEVLHDLLSNEHNIIASIDSALSFKRKLASGDLKNATAAIVDDRMPHEGIGKGIAKKLRDSIPGIKIVSFSSTKQDWGDVNLINGTTTTANKLRAIILKL